MSVFSSKPEVEPGSGGFFGVLFSQQGLNKTARIWYLAHDSFLPKTSCVLRPTARLSASRPRLSSSLSQAKLALFL